MSTGADLRHQPTQHVRRIAIGSANRDDPYRISRICGEIINYPPGSSD